MKIDVGQSLQNLKVMQNVSSSVCLYEVFDMLHHCYYVVDFGHHFWKPLSASTVEPKKWKQKYFNFDQKTGTFPQSKPQGRILIKSRGKYL